MSKTTNPSTPKPSITHLRESLDESTLCANLQKRIIATAQTIYFLSPSSRQEVLISPLPDGTPVAQLVQFDANGTLVLMEEQGLPPSKTRTPGRSIAMQNLLSMLETSWGDLCRTSRGSAVQSRPYYVVKAVVTEAVEKGL